MKMTRPETWRVFAFGDFHGRQTGPMPALTNARHERFAQGLAKGETADAAYEAAGFKPSRFNASRLKTKDNITARVAELQSRAATRAEITVASITARLLKIAEKGEISNDAPMLSVARASLMDAAKLNGLVIDQSKVEAEVKATVRTIERRVIDPLHRDT